MFNNTITDIFFDLDHTLWDFEKSTALTFQSILEKNQVEVVLADFLAVYRPTSREYWKLYKEGEISKVEMRFKRLKRTFDSMGIQISDVLVATLDREYIEYHPAVPSLMPYADEVLAYLLPKYKLHIITNGFWEIQEKKLRGSGIYQYFDQIINSEMAGVQKPHPHIFQLALQSANVIPENALMIGDSLEVDVMGAKAVGMHALHINSNREPEHKFCTILESLDALRTFL